MTISPFLMPQAVVRRRERVTIVPIYPADEISVDHSHQGMANGMNVDPATGVAANDRYAMNQEGLTTNSSGQIVTKAGATPTAISLAQKQKAEADISHIDCDTIPFMWLWAKNFVLFDNFRQTIVGPSTPNAIALIAGQSGETQWALHNSEGATDDLCESVLPERARRELRPSNRHAGQHQRLRADRRRSRPVPGLEAGHKRDQAALQLRRERGQSRL